MPPSSNSSYELSVLNSQFTKSKLITHNLKLKTMQDAIETIDLKRSFGAVHAVAGLTMRVPVGRIYGLIGADGAGKTTTLRMLCGALLPDGGQATVMGIDV